MNIDEQFVKSEYSIQELEQFRDKNGFIDLTKAGINFTDNSREIVGNPDRVKNWVDFNGKKALIKSEVILDEERNYGIYAELIVEEIAKKMGIPTAHYDLVKMLDDNGKETFGVLSESVVNVDEGEQLVSLRDIIGDEPIENSIFEDTTSYDFTVDNLKKNLLLDGYSEEDVKKVLSEYKKRLAFSCAVLDVDKHTENIAFIKKVVDGKNIIELSPNFDSESSLLLDYDVPTAELLLADTYGLSASTDIAQPKIGLIKSEKQGGYDSLWKDTLKVLQEDKEVADFCNRITQNGFDIDDVLDDVEKRIKTCLPDNARYLAKYAYNFRNEAIGKVIGSRGKTEPKNGSVSSILEGLVSYGMKNKIRTGEQVDTGEKMEKSMDFSLDAIMRSIRENYGDADKDK